MTETVNVDARGLLAQLEYRDLQAISGLVGTALEIRPRPDTWPELRGRLIEGAHRRFCELHAPRLLQSPVGAHSVELAFVLRRALEVSDVPEARPVLAWLLGEALRLLDGISSHLMTVDVRAHEAGVAV